MKSHPLFTSAWSLLLVSLCWVMPVHGAAAAAGSSSAKTKPGVLQVQVNVPPSWTPMFEDRITGALVANLSDVFHRQGYQGDIEEVSRYDEPTEGSSLLTIDLFEWRMRPIGDIDCTFTANLQTARANRHLGIYTGTGFRWMNGPGRFGLADSFSDAAESAFRDLYTAVKKTDLLPGTKK